MKKFADFMIRWRVILCVFVLVLTAICGAMIGRVNINTDMTKYLADSSQMKEGLKVMSDELAATEQANVIRVLFKGISAEKKEKVVVELSKINYVSAVNYDAESKEFNKGDYSLFKVETTYDYGSVQEKSIRKNIENLYKNDNVIVKNGASETTSIPTNILIGVGIAVVAILFVLCYSWIEPFLYILMIAIAVVMNMGSNAIFGSVSQITNLVAIILQAIFTMDYSIMLISRYRDERRFTQDKKEAMSKALAKGFSSVTGSSIATAVAVIMLSFLSFKLGTDMGVVFAKAILCSGLTVIGVLPTIIVGCDKAIEVTSKPSLPVPSRLLASMSNGLRFVMPIVLVGLFIVSFYIQDATGISFTSPTEDEISKIIPNTNAVVALYNNDDADKIEKISKEIEKDSNVVGVMSYPTTLGKENTAKEMSEMVKEYTAGSDISIDESVLELLYYDYYKKGELPTMTVSEFVNFLADDVATNKNFSGQIDKAMLKQIDSLKTFADPKKLTKNMTAAELAKTLGMKESDIKSLFVLYYSKYGGVDTGSMKLRTFVNFISNDVLKNKTYASMFDDATKAKVEQLKTYTDVDKMTKKMSYIDIAKILGMDSETVKLLYVYYYSKAIGYTPKSMDLPTFVEFLTKKVVTNKAFASYFDKETMAQFSTVATFTNKKLVQKQLHSEEMSKLLGIDKSMLDLIYVFYHGSQKVSDTKLSLSEFTNFIVNKILPNPMLSGEFDDATKASITNINQLINLAISGQKLGPAQVSAIFGVPEPMANQLFMMYSQGDLIKQSATLPEITTFLITYVLPDPMYGAAFTPEQKATINQLHQLIMTAMSGAKMAPTQISAIFGIGEAQVTQLYVLYTGIYMNKKAMSPIQLVNYLLEAKKTGGPVGSAIDDNLAKTLGIAQNIMNLTISGTKFNYEQLANMFSIDKGTMKMLFTLHDSYGDISSWKLSMDTIVDFLLNNKATFSSMMSKDSINDLKLAQKLIKGSISGKKYGVNDISELLGMDKATLTQIYLLYISQYGDTSKWKMSIQELVTYLVEDILTNKSLAPMLGSAGDSLKTVKVLVDAVVSNKSYTSKELLKLVNSLSDGLDKNMIDLLYLLYGSMKESDPTWTMSVSTLFEHLSTSVVKDAKFNAFLDDKFKENIVTMKSQLDAGVKQLVGENYSLMLINTLYPSEASTTHNFVGKVDTIMSNELVSNHYLMGASVMTYEMEKQFKQEIMFITLVSAIAVFIVMLGTFKSAIIPTIITLMTHTPVFITISAIGFGGSTFNFIAYVVLQCVVIGMAVNYATTFIKNYIDYRNDYDILEALEHTFSGYLNGILTTGLIISIVTLVLGLGISDPTMGAICVALAIGCIVTIVLTVLCLPAIVVLCDKLIYQETNAENEIAESYQHL